MAQPQGPPGPFPPMQPGQQPSPEQIRQMQQQIAAEAQRAGMSVPQYVEKLKQQAMQQHQAQMAARAQQQQQGGPAPPQGQGGAQPGQQVPIQPGPPKPEAIAVANFLRGQDLKMRTCIFQEKRKDMFKVKRAIRALQSPAYEKARKKNALLPPVTDRVTAENTFKLLPLSLLALRVSKVDPNADPAHAGHSHAKKKRVKGLWTVKVEPQQEARDEYHYVWMYEGSQWKMKLYAALALIVILALVFFPVWPLSMRVGVWYLSMGMLGLLGLFFTMALFRLILFVVTMFAVPPGLWLYPNLFEDVGFFDSFKPLWGWQETKEDIQKKKAAKKAKREAKKSGHAGGDAKISEPVTVSADAAAAAPGSGATASGSNVAANGTMTQRDMRPRIEEVEDD